MKIKELLEMQPALSGMMTRRMPIKLSYAIAKNAKMIAHELEDFQEQRVKVLREHWPFDPKTNKYTIPDEDQPKWQGMYDELIDVETTFQPYTFPFSLLEGQEFSPMEMLVLEHFYTEDGKK